MDEYSEMMVNPNLEEELGMEWNDEPKVSGLLSTLPMHSRPKRRLPSPRLRPLNPRNPQVNLQLRLSLLPIPFSVLSPSPNHLRPKPLKTSLWPTPLIIESKVHW